jgi:rfaE bifunctional protein nucleotidyltransferase chain/domain
MTDFCADKKKTVAQLGELAAKLRAKGKKVVLCHGVFDLMHPGHIKHLEAARKEGDYLFVTVTPDAYVNKGPGRPVFNQYLRLDSIAALSVVDYAAINEWKTAVETLGALKPDVYVKGTDYSAPEQDVTGGISAEREAVERHGGRLHFTDEITFSSTELLNKFFGVFSEQEKNFLSSFRARCGVSQAMAAVKAASGLKVLVVGDVIIDEYHYCKGMGKPPKDNIISARFIGEERFPGGALACANHIAGICEKVDLVSCLGAQDSREEYILEHLKSNIRPKFFKREDGCTVVKRRYVDSAFLTKLFEIAFVDDRPLPAKTENAIAKHLEKVIGSYDLVLVSDFGHGFITPKLVNILSKAKFLAVNAQTNSANAGYNLVTKYNRADYICIDEPEIRLAAHDKYGDIRGIITGLSKKLRCRRISITRGHMGAIGYDAKKGFSEVPAFAGKIVDRVGAGDSYLSITAPLAASGAPMDIVAFIGSAAAAIKVGIVCNRAPVDPVSLCKFMTTLLK